jgi:SpoVK/Ycf46/Vps4 family AAA+-type ATPase
VVFLVLVGVSPAAAQEPGEASAARVVTATSTKAEVERGELDPRTVRELERAAGKDRKRATTVRVVVYGGTGVGRRAAAVLLAEEWGRSLYRVDLDEVVSRYIGETEKNLARLFSRASERGEVLFFDEADALFGKRTEVRDAHDRYANIEVAYLLAQARAAGVPLVVGVRRERPSLRDGYEGWRVVRLRDGDRDRDRDRERDRDRDREEGRAGSAVEADPR